MSLKRNHTASSWSFLLERMVAASMNRLAVVIAPTVSESDSVHRGQILLPEQPEDIHHRHAAGNQACPSKLATYESAEHQT